VRAAWVEWLAPVFTQGAYITGTYSDEYGLANGLMLQRNVHKDVRRFFDDVLGDRTNAWVCAVERHRYRDILHWHGILAGEYGLEQLEILKDLWQLERGYARVLPVKDGCASYVSKYALKADTDAFDWENIPLPLPCRG